MLNVTSSAKLQVILAAAKTTNDCPVTVSTRDANTGSPTAPIVTSTNGVTAVDVISSTLLTQNKIIDSMSVYNADTVDTVVTVRYYVSSTAYIINVVTLKPGQTLQYEDQLGWSVIPSIYQTGLIASMAGAGTLFNTYTTSKTILPTGSVPTLAPNFFTVGKQLFIRALCGVSNIVTTPGTITFEVKVGSVVAFTTGAIQLNATAHTLLPLWLEIMLTCRSVGSGTSATLMGMGRVQGIAPTLTAGQTDATNTGGIQSAPATAPAVGTGFDSTVSNTLDLWAGFSISNAGNGVQVQQYQVLAY